MAILQPPPINSQIVDPSTGKMTSTFSSFLTRLWNRVGGDNGGSAPVDAKYITQTPNSDLTGEQALSLLVTGYAKVTTGSGVVTTVTTIPNTDITGLGTLSTQSGTFSGTHSGTSSGTNTGDQTNITGNAATVTTNANLSGDVSSVGNTTTIGAGKVTEAMQVLADNTTNDVSTTKHGYVPKAPNDATKFLDGTGAFSTPTAGSGTVTSVSVTTANGVSGSVATATTTPAITLTLGAISPTSITGTATNDNAASGKIGEYITASLAIGSAVSLTTDVISNVTSISLTAGDWDVFGFIGFDLQASTTVVTYMDGGSSSTSATLGAAGSFIQFPGSNGTYLVDAYLPIPTDRISIASTTTIYLVAISGFSVGTMKAFGKISARRVR